MAVGVVEIIVSGIVGIIAGIVGQRFFTSDCRIGTGSLDASTTASRVAAPKENNNNTNNNNNNSINNNHQQQPITVVVSDAMLLAALRQREQTVHLGNINLIENGNHKSHIGNINDQSPD